MSGDAIQHGDPDQRIFSSRDVQDAAGLSSRQQNDWDSRGALPHDRTGDEGWRRFSGRDLFVLMICAELRRSFGVPVERLKYVQDFMLQDGADHLGVAIEMMSSLGLGVWLLTDFEKTFIMDSELEFADLWSHGFFGGDREHAFALLKLNPLVNRLLSCLKDPIRLEAHGRGYEISKAAYLYGRTRTPEEAEVLEIIRSGDFERVEVTAPDGKVETIRTTARPGAAARLEDLLTEHEYQTLTVVKKDGQVRNVVQEVTLKPQRNTRAR